MSRTARAEIEALSRRVVACRRCPRLVAWREMVAREKVRRFATEKYWGKPLPGFGDPDARMVIVGLAPAAHGGNRTGRMFTGDESGNWLYRALHRTGFATSAESTRRDDGMVLRECYITAAVRCAPPRNKPARDEIAQCAEFLNEELLLLDRVRVVVGLGRIGFDAAVRAYRAIGRIPPGRKPPFGHGVTTEQGGITFIASYHPSQQNTFTGRLTRPMLDRVFLRARDVLEPAPRKRTR